MNIKRLIIRSITWVASSIATVAVLIVVLNVLSGSSVNEGVHFLWRMVQAPKAVGSIVPSSEALVDALAAPISKEGQNRHLIEVGAGTGVITKELVKRLQPGDVLDVVELDKELVDILVRRFGNHPQVNILHVSITDWKPEYKYDGMVMTIPFNTLPSELVRTIWSHTRSLLEKGAPVSYVAYLGLPHIKQFFLSGAEKEDFEAGQRFLKQQYAEHGFGIKEVFANVPPAEVFYLKFL